MTLSAHADHVLKFLTPVVYCVTCNERLYQGKLPESVEARRAAFQKMDAMTAAAIKGIEIREAKDWAMRTKEQEAAYGEGHAFVTGLRAKGTVTPGPTDRLALNPHTAAKIEARVGLSPKAKREEGEKRLMRWWNWGWSDAENGTDRRKA